MSFLTPLYIAGLAAIALPLVFHLIRRTPRGQTSFSSLMFLTPSPPRITRRSRLDQLLLLFLRALALALLALAFARPFFRESAQFQFDASQGQRLAILVDASASMKRDDLWRQAQAAAAAALADLKSTDRVAVFVFDREVRTLLDFDDQTEIDPRRRASMARQRLSQTAPTWAATDLGGALAMVADRLDALDQGQAAESDVRRRLLLISDFAQGASLEALQAYEWPAGVELEVQSLAPRNPTNAGVHLAGGVIEPDDDSSKSGAEPVPAADDGPATSVAGPSYRVRVVNSDDSASEQFQLVWLNADNQPVGAATQLYVPPGQSRVLYVRRPDESDNLRLMLQGDAHMFDNTLYFAPPTQEEITLAYLGDEAPDDVQGVRYYLERAFPLGHQPHVQVVTPAEHEPLQPPDAPPPRLAVVAQTLNEDRLQELRRYLDRGGQVLAVALDAEMTQSLAPLISPTLRVEEAAPADYALLGKLDFTHPLLAPFADPRYSDFTKIHFWKHRRLHLAAPEGATENEADLHIVARFDNGDPALIERRHGAGRLYVLAASWRPDDSQLARSSKFVPLLLGMIGGGQVPELSAVQVFDRWPLQPTMGQAAPVVRKPDGTEVALAAGAGEFRETDEPGVYIVGEQRFAVNLDPAESQTAPRTPEDLEQFGVVLTDAARRLAHEQRQRQLRDVELEGRQKIWRWLLAAALVVLIFETWLAGRHSRLGLSRAGD